MIAGKYIPSYFEIHIPTNSKLDSIATLPDDLQGIFFHEYLHYLQNIATTFGLNKTWQAFDRIRQIISKVQKTDGEIIIPLSADLVEEERVFLEVMGDIAGSKDLNINTERTIITITAINEVEKESLKKVKPDATVPFIQLLIENAEGKKAEYWLGETAISETMVYLAERKFYDLPPARSFPYEAGYHVAKRIYPPATDHEILFALCDIALMHPYPGYAFYSLLMELKKEEFKFSTTEELYPFGYKLFARTGWDIWRTFRESKEGIQKILDIVYGHPAFEATKIWLQTIIELGYTTRMDKEYFMLAIFRDKIGLGLELGKLKEQLGGPNCINNKHERFLSVPKTINDQIHNIHPSQLIILWQIHNYLLMGETNKKCRLTEICNSSEPKIRVDDTCSSSPWEKSRQEELCPYGAAWLVYGFNKKNFVHKG
jgi:hypothetical protein